jgi:hypothetical protein
MTKIIWTLNIIIGLCFCLTSLAIQQSCKPLFLLLYVALADRFFSYSKVISFGLSVLGQPWLNL